MSYDNALYKSILHYITLIWPNCSCSPEKSHLPAGHVWAI